MAFYKSESDLTDSVLSLPFLSAVCSGEQPFGMSNSDGLKSTRSGCSEYAKADVNVRGKPPAEADGISPDCDDSTSGAGRAYDGYRSGSA